MDREDKDLKAVAEEWSAVVLNCNYCAYCLKDTQGERKLCLVLYPFDFGGKTYEYIGVPLHAHNCHAKAANGNNKEHILTNISWMLSNNISFDVLYK